MAEQMMQHKADEMATKQTIPAGYKQTEVGVIPEDWKISTVGNEYEIKLGKMLDAEKNRGIPKLFLGNRAVQWGYIDITDLSTVPMSRSDIEMFRLCDGDLLVCEGGEVGRAAIWNSPVSECYYQKALHRLRPLRSFNSQVMASLLRYWTDSGFLRNYVTQTSIAHLPREKFMEVPMPIPPVYEQTAIASTLCDTDALLTGLEQLISKKHAMKTATMQQLLTGRTRLPAFALRPDGTPKGYKPSELGQIPEDWDALTYGDIFTFLSTAINSRADLSNSGDFGYIHYGDIHTKWNNKLDLCVFDLPRVSRHLVSPSFVENGDVIMADASEDYDGIGKSVEICNVGDDKIVSGLHTFLLRDKNQLLVDGYRGFLHSIPAVKKAFDRLATGMKVYGISKNNLIVVPVPLPPKQEQTAIATILSDMDSELAALEQKLAKARDLKQGMMQQLLTGRIRLPLPKEA